MARKFSTGLRQAILGTAALVDSFQVTMEDCILHLRSGNQPANSDLIEAGSLLAIISLSGGAFVSGVATNGLEFDDAVDGVISKAAAEDWEGLFTAIGTIGHYRCYANTVVTGASTTAIRFDGSVATSGADLNLSAVSGVVDTPVVVSTFTVTLGP